MNRAHKQVLQAGEIVPCDSTCTSSLDRFNASLFMFSTSQACSGISLDAVMVSDETETNYVTQPMETVMPSPTFQSFYGK